MAEDPELPLFLAIMYFWMSMLVLVTANILLCYLRVGMGWLSSYLLIGFCEHVKKAESAMKP